MSTVVTTRTEWADLPAGIRRAVERTLGSEVVQADSQNEGFSPGSADRIRTAGGARAFVKAVERGRNEGTYDLHRRELRVMEQMPPGVRAPRLLGSYVAEDAVALILEDIDGEHPGAALDGTQVVAVLDALAQFPIVDAGGSSVFLDAAEEFAGDADGWRLLEEAGALSELPSWARTEFERIRTAAERVPVVAAGAHLQHLDCRADNVILDPAGDAWIIDWPWAGIGARWTDAACYLFDVRMRGEDIDVDELSRIHPVFEGVSATDFDVLLAAVTGGYLYRSTLPAPPNMPTLRAFQRREADAGLAWLQERWT